MTHEPQRRMKRKKNTATISIRLWMSGNDKAPPRAKTNTVEGNSDEPRPKAAFDTNPLSPKLTRAYFKVTRPQDQSVFVSKREFVLAHKSEVVSDITNSTLLPPRRTIAHSAGQCLLSLGGRSPPQPPSGVRK